MARKLICSLIAFSLAVPVFWFPPPARACGPFFTRAIFTLHLHPDFPLSDFAGGQLGVLQPSYARSYLVIAYRYASGKNLSKSEQQSILGLWQRRISSWGTAEAEKPGPAERWVLSRRRYMNHRDPEYIDTFRKSFGGDLHVWEYFYYENCLKDSFATAADTLRRRAAAFGPQSPELEQWIHAQDVVFSACNRGPKDSEAAEPKPLAAPSSPLLRADREYQIASFHFYAGDFQKAEREFNDISNEPDSPWKTTATLLAVRARIRKATLKDNAAERKEDLVIANNKLQAILANPKLRSAHASAGRLQSFVEFRIDHDRYYSSLVERLGKQNRLENFGEAVGDYTVFLDEFLGETDESDQEGRAKAIEEGF